MSLMSTYGLKIFTSSLEISKNFCLENAYKQNFAAFRAVNSTL